MGTLGPPGFFRDSTASSRVRLTDDTTIAIYRDGDLRGSRERPDPGLARQ